MKLIGKYLHNVYYLDSNNLDFNIPKFSVFYFFLISGEKSPKNI